MILLLIIYLVLQNCQGVCSTLGLKLRNTPFVSVWNSPTEVCDKHGVQLNLSYFDIITNSKDKFQGNNIVIFYKEELGLYPWINKDGAYINGGLPQLSDVSLHLRKLSEDVANTVPLSNFSGLAIIDWEEWRPIFERNGYNENQRIYIRASESLVQKQHPDWPEEEIRKEAERQFQNASRLFIQNSLSAAKDLRPDGFWGLYGFPDCYIDHPGQTNCTNNTRNLNNRLRWLFSESTVYLPSIYLNAQFGNSQDRYWKVHGTLEETFRLRQMFGSENVPIVPYTRYRYGDTRKFYTKADLCNTVGQVAEAGLNGVVLWDSSSSFQTRNDCVKLRDFLDTTLGPFVRNVSEQAKQCSINLCNSHGRCRKNEWSTVQEETFLSLLKTYVRYILLLAFNIDIGHIRTTIRNTDYIIIAEEEFSCSCYNGWRGNRCQYKLELSPQ